VWILVLILGLLVPGCDRNERDGTERPVPQAPPQPAEITSAGSPNLLLITMDTTRADALGAYGQRWDTSPHIDRLAETGVLFEYATTSSPETLPSHATIFTGTWPYVHGVRANAGYVLSDRNVTLAEVLRGRGYRTGAEVAAPVLRRETQVTQGFEHYRGAESLGVELKRVRFTQGVVHEQTKPMRTGADITNRGIEFLRRHRDEKFFLWVHYFDPHDPYSAPPGFNQKIPASRYHAEVASADFQIGRLIEALEQLGLRETTLVVLTADHGEGLGEHGEPSHSYFVYDSTMHVPLILWGLSRLAAGVRVSSPVRSVDIAPTVLDLLGLRPLAGVQGVSLAPLLSGGATDLLLTGYGEATRFLATFGLPPLRFVREGRWKYIHKVNSELYDMIADPKEQRNLVASRPEVAERLRARLEEMLREAPPQWDDAQAATDAQTAAELVALGYVHESLAPALDDELASLALSGADPATKIGATKAISEAIGLMHREEYAKALAHLEPVKERNPETPYVLGLVSQALLGLGRSEEAIAGLRRLLELEPANVRKGSDLVAVLAELGRPEEALEVLDGLLVHASCDERLRLQQKDLLYGLRRYGMLLDGLADGAARCPDLRAHLNNYAWALATVPDAELRDGVKALQLIRSALARLEEPDPGYVDTLTAALAESGDFEGAIRTQSELLQRMRSAGAPAEVLEVLGEHLDAYRVYRAVRDPAPEDS
jgi:arylsulfatase A-like enzyme